MSKRDITRNTEEEALRNVCREAEKLLLPLGLYLLLCQQKARRNIRELTITNQKFIRVFPALSAIPHSTIPYVERPLWVTGIDIFEVQGWDPDEGMDP